MECKERLKGSCFFKHLVLIETLWNVKITATTVFGNGQVVLIETLWNVKILAKVVNQEELGINRNIVECKVELRF